MVLSLNNIVSFIAGIYVAQEYGNSVPNVRDTVITISGFAKKQPTPGPGNTNTIIHTIYNYIWPPLPPKSD